jgi:uncharacterized protein YpiB (UPF0302 family)
MSQPSEKPDEDDDDFYDDLESFLSNTGKASTETSLVDVSTGPSKAVDQNESTNLSDRFAERSTTSVQAASLIADIDKFLDEDDEEVTLILSLIVFPVWEAYPGYFIYFL